MKILDLFCGGGGAAVGYSRAGFEVIGVDIRDQKPGYPFTFVRGDALEYLAEHGWRFDAIHASPPCQGYSYATRSADSAHSLTRGKNEPRMIPALKELLIASGKPYIIENVDSKAARADLAVNLFLCGTMFGLPISRHRVFECSGFKAAPIHHRNCKGTSAQYAKERGWDRRDMTVSGKGRHAGTSAKWSEIMGGITWRATQRQIAEMIPPCYSEYIGKELIKCLKRQ